MRSLSTLEPKSFLIGFKLELPSTTFNPGMPSSCEVISVRWAPGEGTVPAVPTTDPRRPHGDPSLPQNSEEACPASHTGFRETTPMWPSSWLIRLNLKLFFSYLQRKITVLLLSPEFVFSK